MAKYWDKPTYELRSHSGKRIVVDVTTSAAPGLPPSRVVIEKLIPFLKKRNVRTVLDFGAGALRHTVALLDAGFEVCAVEFEEALIKPRSSKVRAQVQKHPNFSALVWPRGFINDKRKFDAALLVYVIQVMPVPKERAAVIKHVRKKLKSDAYLFYAARYGQVTPEDSKHRVSDGYYRWPSRKAHSFYREFTTEATHMLFARHKLHYIRHMSERGTDQMLLYAKGKGTWI